MQLGLEDGVEGFAGAEGDEAVGVAARVRRRVSQVVDWCGTVRAAYVKVLNTPISLEFSKDARTAMMAVVEVSAVVSAGSMVSRGVVWRERGYGVVVW